MKFSFQEKGTGETIVLIHSYLWDSEMWREQIDLLSKNIIVLPLIYQVIEKKILI